MQDFSEASPQELERARNVAMRAAAIDTGALKGLYEVDRGITFTVATEGVMWENMLHDERCCAHQRKRDCQRYEVRSHGFVSVIAR